MNVHRYSNYSLRHPRSLKEAFGPTADWLTDDRRRDDWFDRLIFRVSVGGLCMFAILLAKGLV